QGERGGGQRGAAGGGRARSEQPAAGDVRGHESTFLPVGEHSGAASVGGRRYHRETQKRRRGEADVSDASRAPFAAAESAARLRSAPCLPAGRPGASARGRTGRRTAR